jgi:lipoprotein-releasing system ATP-binding protein
MIKASNIHKFYGNLEVLKGVDIHIKTGEVVSIVGESGAGKSTLLQILGTLDHPSHSNKYNTEIGIAGESFINMNDKQLSKFRNQNIGFVFQFHQLLPEFTALENVLLPTKIGGANEKEALEKAYALFEDLKIEQRLNHKPNQLSGGEAQRVAVARALINSPKIIFADEPTGNLDPETANGVFDMLTQLVRDAGIGALIATHNMDLAERMDRILEVKAGRIISY